MKITLAEALYAIDRGMTPEDYAKRIARIRRLANERDSLEDALTVLTCPEDAEKAEKKRNRLHKVLAMIEELTEGI